MDLDFDNLEKQCRFCLKLISMDDYYEDLFPEGVISGMLKEKMSKCFNIEEINFQERLPNKICSSCVKKLDEFYLFSSEFEINQEKLKHSTIKTGLLIENINSERERDHSTAASGIEAGHQQLVLKRHTCITERLKVLAIKDDQSELNTNNKNFYDENDDSSALIADKKEKDDEDEKEAYQLNKIGGDILKSEPAESENSDYKSPTKIDELILHDVQWAKDNIYECQICSSQFKNGSEVQSHMKIHSYESPINRDELPQDCNGISNANVEFLHSSEAFTASRMHNVFQRQCHLCPAIFNSKDLLNKHINQHVTTENVCDKVRFENLGSTSMKIICKICKKGFFTRSRYDLHVIKEHDPEIEVPSRRKGRIFQCNDCNKIFKNKVDITRHVSIHLKHKSPHVCSVCGKEYVFPVALKTHMLKHDPDYKIECSVCSEIFSKRKDLQSHKCLSISPSTKYKCNTCNLEFTSLNYLKIHKELDHGIGAPYTCNYCTRTFLSNDGLNAHMKEHHHFEIDDSKEMSLKTENIDDGEENQTTDLLFDEDLTTSLEILMCSLCGAICLTNQEFQEHMASHIIM